MHKKQQRPDVAQPDDLQLINEQLFALVDDAEDASALFRLLGASDSVIHRLRSSSPNARLTATSCRMPLVVVSDAFDHAVHVDPDHRVSVISRERPPALQSFVRFVLEVAWATAQRDVTVAQLQFGMSLRSAHAMRALRVQDLVRLSTSTTPVLKLRGATQPALWDHLLIGSRCTGPVGIRLAQQAGLLSASL